MIILSTEINVVVSDTFVSLSVPHFAQNVSFGCNCRPQFPQNDVTDMCFTHFLFSVIFDHLNRLHVLCKKICKCYVFFSESVHAVPCLTHRTSLRGESVRRFGWAGNLIVSP